MTSTFDPHSLTIGFTGVMGGTEGFWVRAEISIGMPMAAPAPDAVKAAPTAPSKKGLRPEVVGTGAGPGTAGSGGA